MEGVDERLEQEVDGQRKWKSLDMDIEKGKWRE